MDQIQSSARSEQMIDSNFHRPVDSQHFIKILRAAFTGSDLNLSKLYWSGGGRQSGYLLSLMV